MFGWLSALFLGSKVALEKDEKLRNQAEYNRKQSLNKSSNTNYNIEREKAIKRKSMYNWLIAKEYGVAFEHFISAVWYLNVWMTEEEARDVASDFLVESVLAREGYGYQGRHQLYREYSVSNDLVEYAKWVRSVIKCASFEGYCERKYESFDINKSYDKVVQPHTYARMLESVRNEDTLITLEDDFEECVRKAELDYEEFRRLNYIPELETQELEIQDYPLDFEKHNMLLKWQQPKKILDEYYEYVERLKTDPDSCWENKKPFKLNKENGKGGMLRSNCFNSLWHGHKKWLKSYKESVEKGIWPLEFHDWLEIKDNDFAENETIDSGDNIYKVFNNIWGGIGNRHRVI